MQAWIGYKETSSSGSAAFKVNRYYHTEWFEEDKLTIRIEGLNMDAVYENFVRQIAAGNLQSNQTESLKQSVERNEQIENLKRQSICLQGKIRKEKQLNQQMQMNEELRKIKKKMEELS